MNTVSLKKYFNVMRQFGGWDGLEPNLLAALNVLLKEKRDDEREENEGFDEGEA